jgi:hypothetical protein
MRVLLVRLVTGVSVLALVSSLLGAGVASASTASVTVLPFQPPASNGGAFSVALSGSLAAVGEPQTTVGGTNFVGQVIVFHKTTSGWQDVAQVVPPSPYYEEAFGSSVAIHGSSLLIETNSSSYLYTKGSSPSAWTLTQTFPEGGGGVALTAAYAVIGDPSYPSYINPVGRTFVYKHSTSGWQSYGYLSAAGYSVSVARSTIAVGGDSNNATFVQASVYQLKSGLWTNVAYPGPYGSAGSVSLTSSATTPVTYTLAIGAPDATVNEGGGCTVTHEGVTYVYVGSGSTWTQTSQLSIPFSGTLCNAEGDHFGSAVAISGTTLLASAPNYFNTEAGQGAVAVYKYAGGAWTLGDELHLPYPAGPDENFGEAIAMSGTTALISEPSSGTNGPGSVYVAKPV